MILTKIDLCGRLIKEKKYMEHFQCECGFDDCELEISDQDYLDAFKFHLNKDDELILLSSECKHKKEYKTVLIAKNYILVKKE